MATNDDVSSPSTVEEASNLQANDVKSNSVCTVESSERVYRSVVKWTSQEAWSGRNVLVTGNSGFLGSAVGRVLLAADAVVHGTGLSRMPETCTFAHRMRLPDEVDPLIERIRPQTIFHLAAPVSPAMVPDMDAAHDAIVEGSDAVAIAAHRVGARLIHVGSCAEYGAIAVPYAEEFQCEPSGDYGVLKHQATQRVVEKKGLDWTIVRPFRAIGPTDSASVVWAACRAAVRQEIFSMTDGLQVREWNHVDAIAHGIVAAGAHPEAVHQIINLGGGPRLSVRDIVHRVFELAAVNKNLVHLGARPRRAHEVDALFGDHTKSRAMWGEIVQPSLDETLSSMLRVQTLDTGGAA